MAVDVRDLIIAPTDFSSVDTMLQRAQAQNLERRRLEELQKQRELSRQAEAAKLIGKEFAPGSLATKTPADSIINAQLGTLRKKYADLIHNNPNTDLGSLTAGIAEDMTALNQYSADIKAGIDKIKATLPSYKELPGIDLNSLESAANTALLYKKDPATGKLVQRMPGEPIDLSVDYLAQTLQQNPGAFVMGDVPFTQALSQMKDLAQEREDIQKRSIAGGHTVEKWKAKMYPWEELITDGKGDVTGIRTKSAPATIGGQMIKDPITHEPLQVASPETLAMFSGPGTNAWLTRETDNFIEKNKYDPKTFAKGTDEYNMISRHVLLDRLQKMTPNRFSRDQEKNMTTTVVNRMAGIGGENEKKNKTDIAEALGNIFTNKPDYLGQADQINDPAYAGRSLRNVTFLLPLGGLKAGRGENFEYGRTWYDAQKRSLVQERITGTGDNKKSSYDEIPESKIGQFITRVATANGTSIEQVKKSLADMGYKNGRFSGVAAAPAPAPSAPAQQSKATPKTPSDDEVFSGLKGKPVEGGTVVKAGQKQWFNPGRYGSSPYYAIVKNAQGKEEEKPFKTKGDLLAFIQKGAPKSAPQNKPKTVSADKIKEADDLIKAFSQ